MKEQSSISTQKIHLPNKELVGLKRSEEQKEVTKEKTTNLQQEHRLNYLLTK